MQDLPDIAGRWHTEREERRAAVEGRLAEVKQRNSKLYEVLKALGRDAPNLGDLAHRLRENHAQIKKLGAQLITIDAEEAPTVEIADEDLMDVAALLVATLKEGYHPAQARAFSWISLKRSSWSARPCASNTIPAD